MPCEQALVKPARETTRVPTLRELVETYISNHVDDTNAVSMLDFACFASTEGLKTKCLGVIDEFVKNDKDYERLTAEQGILLVKYKLDRSGERLEEMIRDVKKLQSNLEKYSLP